MLAQHHREMSSHLRVGDNILGAGEILCDFDHVGEIHVRLLEPRVMFPGEFGLTCNIGRECTVDLQPWSAGRK